MSHSLEGSDLIHAPNTAPLFTRKVVFVLLTAAIGVAAFTALPLFLGAYVDERGFTLQIAGRLASAETIGMAVGTIVVSYYSANPAMELRRTATAALAMLFISQLAATYVGAAVGFAVTRFFAGVAAGLAYGLAAVYIARLPRPDPLFAVHYGLTCFVGPLMLIAVPHLLSSHGLKGLFLACSILALVGVFVTTGYPKRKEVLEATVATEGEKTPSKRINASMVLLLCTLFLNFTCNSGLWIFIDRIGANVHVAQETLGILIALGMLGGLLGTALVAVLGDKWGRLPPVILGHAILLIASAVLFFARTGPVYLAGIIALNGGVNILTPYFLAEASSVDSSGRSAALCVLAYVGGYGIGPAAFAAFISDSGFETAFVFVSMGFVLSLVLSIISFRGLSKSASVAMTATSNQRG